MSFDLDELYDPEGLFTPEFDENFQFHKDEFEKKNGREPSLKEAARILDGLVQNAITARFSALVDSAHARFEDR